MSGLADQRAPIRKGSIASTPVGAAGGLQNLRFEHERSPAFIHRGPEVALCALRIRGDRSSWGSSRREVQGPPR